MIPALRPGGALLAALALWSLALLLLAGAGLGGRVGTHPDNPALMPALPVVKLDRAGSRLGPATDYQEIAARPLLSGDRRPAPVAIAGTDSDKPLEANLTSVLISGDFKMAILQGKEDGISRRVRLGDVMEGSAWRLVDLQPRRAVLEGPQGRVELDLRVFDGQGGAAPTPLATVPVAQAPAAPGNGAPAATPAPPGANASTGAAGPAATADANTAPVTPEQQVEAIRRRIEARRAMRAAQAEQDQVPPAAPQQQVQ
ncbi:hypothetical protein [Arenimonas sp. MALMAid1274]|uniref:hypothetical protein n=1 Tax=Arenimonas sp. MALMAid1274 TaxID=3411630 RepID=UPI003B9F4738